MRRLAPIIDTCVKKTYTFFGDTQELFIKLYNY